MADLIARLISDLSPVELADFYRWIEGMTFADDREDGPDFANWMRHHETVPGDTIWVFFDPATHLRIGSASLVSQDRYLPAPQGGWVIAGVNIAREQRGKGFGKAVMSWLEIELNRRARLLGCPLPVRLAASNPIAIHLYLSLGFRSVSGEKEIFEKIYPDGFLVT